MLSGEPLFSMKNSNITVCDRVAREIEEILFYSYRVETNGSRKVESNTKQTFWNDVCFKTVEINSLKSNKPVICIYFVFSDDVCRETHCFRVDFHTAVTRWELLVGRYRVDGNEKMFAAEIIWYLVIFIGEERRWQSDSSVMEGIRYINRSDWIFGPL